MLLNTIGESRDMSRTHSCVTATVVVSPVFCVASFSLKVSVLRTCFLVLHQSEDPLLTQCVSIFVLEVFSRRSVAWSFISQRDGEASRLSVAS